MESLTFEHLLFSIGLIGFFLFVRKVMGKKSSKIQPPFSLDEQAAVVDPDIRKSKLINTKSDDDCLKYLHDDAKTLLEALYRGRSITGDGDCLGRLTADGKHYEWTSYTEVVDRARAFGSGLVSLDGVEPGSQTNIGIYATNSVEYVVAEFGCYHHSIVVVPLYDTLGPEACTFCINQASMRCIVVDTEDRVQAIVSQASKLEKLKYIIVTGKMLDSYKSKAKGFGITIFDLTDIEAIGRRSLKEVKRPRPSDVAVICYTSGTTGKPKGVVLSHENIISNISGVCLQLGKHTLRKDDTMISFLPLAHMFERCCDVVLYMVGGRIGFYGGDIKKLSDDMKILQPTVLPCVPRLLNRIHDKVNSMAKGSRVKSWLLNRAVAAKRAELDEGIIRSDGFWDRLVFRNVRENMGGKVRLIVTGSAPLAGDIMSFIRAAMGCLVVEGYGQTESVCPCTMTFPGETSTGHVGPPTASAYVKIVDVPDMEYYAINGSGEVCIKGPTVFQGYFRDPEGTANVIDDEGWLHTGDIGTWRPNGTLAIIDRKKHIFKLAQGEYIAPEKIEACYSRSIFVANIFVYGESLKSSLVGIVVPDVDALEIWARKNHFRGSIRDMCSDKRLKKAIIDDMNDIAKRERLNGFELVKDIYLFPEGFSINNGLLTPTLKTKRPECRKYFVRQLEDMYRGLE